MNVWKVRHEGSPVASADLSFEQVMQGLLNGRFDPTDEVKGPADADWKHLEDHPAFAEAALDVEPPPQRAHDEGTHLDMTPIIDVALVLLIFFILTTSYANLQKIIEAAEASSGRQGAAIRKIPQKDVEDKMVHVRVKQEGDQSRVFLVKPGGEEEVPMRDLVATLRSYAGGDAKRRILLLDHDPKVPHGVIVTVQDNAKTAGMDQVLLLIP